MSHNDRFMRAMNEVRYLDAIRLAIQLGEHKNNRNGAWSWADEAVRAAKLAGMELEPGPYRWPDFEAMREQMGMTEETDS